MPESKIRERGGVVKVRTIHPDPKNPSRYARIYIVRRPGKKGGRTIMGKIKGAKRRPN